MKKFINLLNSPRLQVSMASLHLPTTLMTALPAIWVQCITTGTLGSLLVALVMSSPNWGFILATKTRGVIQIIRSEKKAFCAETTPLSARTRSCTTEVVRNFLSVLYRAGGGAPRVCFIMGARMWICHQQQQR